MGKCYIFVDIYSNFNSTSVMKHSSILTLAIVLLFVSKIFSQQPCKEIIGYYPGWQWYDRNKLVKPATIDYSKYTVINFAFFDPKPNGNIIGTDPYSDEILLLGEIDWSTTPPSYLPNTSLVDLAHNSGVKVLISVGGWTMSNAFPIIAADSTKRSNFAHSCVQLISMYNLDGIDLDWEYPGYTPHNGSAADKNNFTALLQEVRDSIDTYGLSVNKPMLLTSAVGASTDRMDDIDWPVVKNLLNIINLMSYDFFGAFDSLTNHNSPLYAPLSGDSTFNIDSAVNKLVNHYNVPPGKITVGVPFYGRSSKTVGTPGLHVPCTGYADNVTFSADDGSPLYYNVLAKSNLFTPYWDSVAKVPYMLGNGSLNTFLSYDDANSVALKAKYIVDNNLLGAIVWEITGDYIESAPNSGIISATPLIDTLNFVFCDTLITSQNYFDGSGPEIKTYPNPVQGNLQVEFENSEDGSILNIFNLYGDLVYSKMIEYDRVEINTKNWSDGLYLINIESIDKILTGKFIVQNMK